MSKQLKDELAVLELARKQIEPIEQYTSDLYVGFYSGDSLLDKDDDEKKYAEATHTPGSHTVTCAIGSVEHAIYLHSKAVITEDERNEVGRSVTPIVRNETPLGLYSRVMARLNKNTIAAWNKKYRKQFGDSEGWSHFEDPNTSLSESQSHPIVLAIIDDTIEEVRTLAGV